jgi:hypothetical protein
MECIDTDEFFDVAEEAGSKDEDVEELDAADFMETAAKTPKDTSSEPTDTLAGP